MKKSTTVGIGILGGGGILGAHAPALRLACGQGLGEVKVVAETSPARDDAIRDLLGADIRIVRDYHEVLSMPEVDAVVILLPHQLHMPAAVGAAQAGKHILIEKVMARNIWECDRMNDACEKAGVTLTVCHDRRYHSEWMAFKQIVDTGMLGDIFSWKLEHNQNVAIPDTSWAYWKDGIGGGSIMSCLTHQIDALRWMGGEVDSVACMSMARPERMQGEFLGSVLARMRSGALAQLSINWWTRSNYIKNGLWYELIHACGTKGEAYYMSGKGTWLLLHERNEAAAKAYGDAVFSEFVKVPDGGWPGHVRCTDQWLRMLRGEPADVTTTGRDSRKTVEVAEAAYLAVERDATVSLPIKPQPWKDVGMPMKTGGFFEGLDVQKGIKS
jgi:predicted dehydrogenase